MVEMKTAFDADAGALVLKVSTLADFNCVTMLLNKVAGPLTIICPVAAPETGSAETLFIAFEYVSYTFTCVEDTPDVRT